MVVAFVGNMVYQVNTSPWFIQKEKKEEDSHTTVIALVASLAAAIFGLVLGMTLVQKNCILKKRSGHEEPLVEGYAKYSS